MNLQRYKGYYQFDLYNVAFFGRGWNPEPFRTSGHLTVLLAEDLSTFVFFKFGDYGGLTWIEKVEQENIAWLPHEVSFMNDEVLKDLTRTSYKYTDVTKPMWETIYGGERMVELDKKWAEYTHYPFTNNIIGHNPQVGDILIDNKDGDIIDWSYGMSDYFVRLVMNNEGNRFEIQKRDPGAYMIKVFTDKSLDYQ